MPSVQAAAPGPAGAPGTDWVPPPTAVTGAHLDAEPETTPEATPGATPGAVASSGTERRPSPDDDLPEDPVRVAAALRSLAVEVWSREVGRG
jgi:hypothetical protein